LSHLMLTLVGFALAIPPLAFARRAAQN
jgi:hypothetical protein